MCRFFMSCLDIVFWGRVVSKFLRRFRVCRVRLFLNLGKLVKKFFDRFKFFRLLNLEKFNFVKSELRFIFLRDRICNVGVIFLRGVMFLFRIFRLLDRFKWVRAVFWNV